MSDLVVMLGDSLSAGNAWNRAFPGLAIRNMGVDGDTWAGLWNRLNEVAILQPAKVFLQIGINDLLRGAPPDEIVAGHRRIWRDLGKKSPETRLYVISLLPYLEEALPGLPPNLDIIYINLALAEKAEQSGLDFINLFPLFADEDYQLRLDYTSDGLHLTPKGYRVWEEALRPVLEP
ncbi:MAG: GDSL-type esterase/lipase family protein [Candidatus Adiutrix sp.]|jgi:lysophospholipase L1-like esterase|nr:GDSL-type esterase/lipase family protein [Candidatus Adiutrix sp.]